MAASFALPPPQSLEINDVNAAEKWRKFHSAWSNYALATELANKPEPVQVATLLTVIGEDAREVFSTFREWTTDGDEQRIGPVLEKFAQYCQPTKNVPFERFVFNKRQQEPGEPYEHYRTALRKLSESCQFDVITPKEILRDRLLFGITDNKVRERLLRETNLTLEKTDEICRAAESMATQMKIMADGDQAVHAVKSESKRQQRGPAVRGRNGASAGYCGKCGRRHDLTEETNCPAFDKKCFKCQQIGHFSNRCRHTTKTRSVRAVDDEEEVFMLSEVSTVDAAQVVTVKLESGNYLRFQIDSGAQCNVIPLSLYEKATKDYNRRFVRPVTSSIVAYGGGKLAVVGHVTIQVSRRDIHCKLECKLVDSDQIRPILGRKACIGMKLIEYHDNDELNQPETQASPVYSVSKDDTQINRESLIKRFPKVFGDGVGCMEGEYHIKVDESVDPVQHAPRRVPVAIRARLQDSLDDLQRQQIIAPVTQPTKWISSMVVVPKRDSQSLRICLDPKDLNRAIEREHYPLPTIEDVATRLHGAKVFSLLDVRSGFWHVMLDEPSSFLTTFNTPFGRYRWKRLPFGICSAPEVFQRKMHQLVEGLSGIEVIADDFAVVGFGDNIAEAHRSHDTNMMAFVQRCEDRGVKLNTNKMQLRIPEIPFIGHVMTSEGLKVDPRKVRAILEMPRPTDVPAVQRLLGMTQYLAKFLPHLSDTTKALRELTLKETDFQWDEPQQKAFEAIKSAVTSTPVLRYYNLDEEVTLQCDASQSGLGAALLQAGQPVAYASRALTPTEERYAQIEKELLAVVFACQRFDAYVYGRANVNVESDHKPLEIIMRKKLDSAPKRLQRMLLAIQKYDINLKYKRGDTMYLADTLSRAYLPEVCACEIAKECETIDHRTTLPVTDKRWQQLQLASEQDRVLQKLRDVIRRGWPSTKSGVPDCVRPYFDSRDELTVQDALVFKRDLLVVPTSMRRELMTVAHTTHMGIEGCLRRMRDTLYWPRMAAEVRAYVSACEICLSMRDAPGKEPLMQHEVIARPWSKVAVDLCESNGRTLLVIVDYYSNFVEVARLGSVTSRSVIHEMAQQFARHGIPDMVMSDNGPQFASAEFAVFAAKWRFEHVTSSPRYPTSNGKAENAVKTVKRLFAKCRDSNESEFLALLDLRNTPTEGVGTSPAQRLMGRRCKTLLPAAGTLLMPRHSTEDETRGLMGAKRRQKFYADQHAKPLSSLEPGDTVRMRLPGQKRWSVGTCIRQVAPRSYKVDVDGVTYRRNRRQLVSAGEPPVRDPMEYNGSPHDDKPTVEGNGAAESVQCDAQVNGQPPQPAVWQSPRQCDAQVNGQAPQPAVVHSPRRSGRATRRPSHLHDYV